jgi:hypothetical protein
MTRVEALKKLIERRKGIEARFRQLGDKLVKTQPADAQLAYESADEVLVQIKEHEELLSRLERSYGFLRIREFLRNLFPSKLF